MYCLLITEDECFNHVFHVFTSVEKAEEWIEETYKYLVVPEYKILEFEDINPTPRTPYNDLF
jgi:hypothetical protein